MLKRKNIESFRKNKGLTLTELLFAIAVFGILIVTVGKFFFSGKGSGAMFAKRSSALTDIAVLFSRLRSDLSGLKNVFVGDYVDGMKKYEGMWKEEDGGKVKYYWYVYDTPSDNEFYQYKVRKVEYIFDREKHILERVVKKVTTNTVLKKFAFKSALYVTYSDAGVLLKEKFNNILGFDLQPKYLSSDNHVVVTTELTLTYRYKNPQTKREVVGDFKFKVASYDGVAIRDQRNWNSNACYQPGDARMVIAEGVDFEPDFSSEDSIIEWARALQDFSSNMALRDQILNNTYSIVYSEVASTIEDCIYSALNNFQKNYDYSKVKDRLAKVLEDASKKKSDFFKDDPIMRQPRAKLIAAMMCYEIGNISGGKLRDDSWDGRNDNKGVLDNLMEGRDVPDDAMDRLKDKLKDISHQGWWIFGSDISDLLSGDIESELKSALRNKDAVVKPALTRVWQRLVSMEREEFVKNHEFWNHLKRDSAKCRGNFFKNLTKQLMDKVVNKAKADLYVEKAIDVAKANGWDRAADEMKRAWEKIKPEIEARVAAAVSDIMAELGAPSTDISSYKEDIASSLTGRENRRFREAIGLGNSDDFGRKVKDYMRGRYVDDIDRYFEKLARDTSDLAKAMEDMPEGVTGKVDTTVDNFLQGKKYKEPRGSGDIRSGDELKNRFVNEDRKPNWKAYLGHRFRIDYYDDERDNVWK